MKQKTMKLRRSKEQKAADKQSMRDYYKSLQQDFFTAIKEAPGNIRSKAQGVLLDGKNHFSINNNVWLLMQAYERGEESNFTGEVKTERAWNDSGVEILDGDSYHIMYKKKMNGFKNGVWSVLDVYDFSQSREYMEDQQKDSDQDSNENDITIGEKYNLPSIDQEEMAASDRVVENLKAFIKPAPDDYSYIEKCINKEMDQTAALGL